MSLQQSALIKAEELAQEGEKTLKKFSLFSSTKYDDAVELFKKAATQYKIAKKEKESGDYFKRAGEISQQLKNNHEALQNYVNAGKAYRKVDPAATTQLYNIAIKMHLENNKFTTAAKLYKELGDIAVEDSDLAAAIKHYNNAADCYSGEGQTTTANQCKITVAHISAQIEDYDRAIAIYEEVALGSLDNNLLKWSVKDYFFKAMLCHLAVGAKGDDFDSAEAALHKYEDLDPAFESTREAQLIVGLIEAGRAFDLDKFSDCVYDYDKISKLDDWKTSILFQVKSELRRDGDGLDDAEDDLS